MLFYVIALESSLQVTNLHVSASSYRSLQQRKILPMPFVSFGLRFDRAYFCGARAIGHETLRGDFAHACHRVIRHIGRSSMVLSRPIRGSIRTTGRFHSRPMCEDEGFLTPSASVRVLIEVKQTATADGRASGRSFPLRIPLPHSRAQGIDHRPCRCHIVSELR